jgi:hypothetical protein
LVALEALQRCSEAQTTGCPASLRTRGIGNFVTVRYCSHHEARREAKQSE